MFSISALPPLTAAIERFGTSYGVVVPVPPFAMPFMNVERSRRDVRISTGIPGGEKTCCEVVAHDGAGRMGRSKLQSAARRVSFAATASDAACGAVVRVFHSAAVRVQATVNASSRVGWPLTAAEWNT